jgi:hypothetical protein
MHEPPSDIAALTGLAQGNAPALRFSACAGAGISAMPEPKISTKVEFAIAKRRAGFRSGMIHAGDSIRACAYQHDEANHMQIWKPVAAMSLLLSAAIAPAHAELVTNGNFETGDLSGFSVGPGGIGFVGVDAVSPHTGSFAAFFAGTDPNAQDRISQTIATIPGDRYQVSFFLQGETSAETPDNAFVAQFGGVSLLSLANDAGFGYRQFSQTITATSAQSVLSFTGYNAPSAYDLDDVSVLALGPEVTQPTPTTPTPTTPTPITPTPVPEPGTIALLLSGMLGLAGRRRKASGLREAG